MSLDHNTDSQPLKLLSLDGGGIRGISTLIILKYLMKMINPKNPPKPCEYFDLIGGTSTGGIIAIMLGLLGMDVQTCIDRYEEIASKAFEPKHSKANILFKAKDLWKVQGAYRSENLAAEMKKTISDKMGDSNAKLAGCDSSCKVFVCTFTTAGNTPVPLRSYTTSDSVDSSAGEECTIWQAARATSAAATFFDPIKIGNQKFVDGGTGYNNPVELVLDEAKSIWPDAIQKGRIQCLVSIGTGVPDMKDFGHNLKEVVDTLKAIATQTEETEKRFFRNHEFLGIGDRYFRFNVDQGLAGVGLEEHKKIDRIEAVTDSYLRGPRVKKAVDEFRSARAPEALPALNESERDKLLNWLRYVDPLPYHNDARTLRTAKSTGNWFLTGDFVKWKGASPSFLWLYGKAGCGKTILSSSVIDEIEQQRTGNLAYYFFSFRSEKSQEFRSLLYSLLTQLVRGLIKEDPLQPRKFHVPRAFQELYRKIQPGSDPKIEDLRVAFLSVLGESRETFIVIDALDECPLDNDRDDVINFLAELRLAQSRIHILVTSRQEESIAKMINGMPADKPFVSIQVSIQNSKVDDDIRQYLENCMTTDFKFKTWEKSLQGKVIDHLAQRANGVFRWVGCQLIILRTKLPRPKDIEKALNQLPKNLDETYKRMLSRIDSDGYADEAYAILQWLAFSKRPLKLSEASEVAVFDLEGITSLIPEEQPLSLSIIPDNRFPNVQGIRSILSGLITVSGVDSPYWLEDECSEPDHDPVITLAHFSVKEYLLCDRVPEKFRIREYDAHGFILRGCLAYIRHYDNGNRDSGQPSLLSYACQCWSDHAMIQCYDKDRHINKSQAKKLARLLTGLCGPVFLSAMRTAIYPSESSYITIPDLAPLPSLLRDLRHAKVVEDENFVGKLALEVDGPLALRWAAATGDKGLAKMLLDNGVDFRRADPEDYYHLPTEWNHAGRYGSNETKWHVLHHAVSNGHEEIVRFILEAGEDVNVPDSEGNTALHMAARQGHEATFQLLLASGADKYAKAGEGMTVFNTGVYWNREGIVKILLDTGIDVQSICCRSQTALHVAAAHGNEEIVRLLLSWRADVNAKTLDRYDGSTPLHAAASAWSYWNDWSGVTYGVSEGHTVVIRLLVEHGANIEEDDAQGHTPLDKAILEGHIKIASQLIALGAQLASKTSPINMATWKSDDTEMIEFLLQHGAKLGEYPERTMTALHIAAESAHKKLISFFLKHGARIDARDERGRTPLHVAVARYNSGVLRVKPKKRAKAIQVLLDGGANVDAIDDDGKTPLDLCENDRKYYEGSVIDVLRNAMYCSPSLGESGQEGGRTNNVKAELLNQEDESESEDEEIMFGK